MSGGLRSLSGQNPSWGAVSAVANSQPPSTGGLQPPSSTINNIPLANVNNTQNISPYDPRGAIANIPQPSSTESIFTGIPQYNAAESISKLQPFNPQQFYQNAQPFDPTRYFSGLTTPSLERMLQEGTISSSEFSKISADPALKDAQFKALSKLQEIADNGGLTVADRVRVREILDQVTRQTRMNIGALKQKYAAQGMGGSGVELASSLATEQGSIEGMSQLSSKVAADAANRQFQAIQDAAQLAGTMRAQDYTEAAKKAEAIDAINRFNAAQRSQIYQQDFANQLNLAGAQAQAGQQGYQNVFNLAGALSNTGQQYYQNQFQLANAYDLAQERLWQNRFDQAQAIAQSRNQYWTQLFNLGQANATAGQQYFGNQFNLAQARDQSARAAFDEALAKAQAADNEAYRIWATQFGAQTDLEKARIAATGAKEAAEASQPSTLDRIIGAGGSILGGAIAAGILSDERLKTNIKRFNIEIIPGVPLASWEWKYSPGYIDYGVIAQDLEKVRPDLVHLHVSGYKMVDYGSLFFR